MNYKVKLFSVAFFIFLFSMFSFSQNKGVLSGGLESNFNYFMRDSLIGANDIPQYDNLLYGAESWLNLKFDYDKWEFGVRFDMFNNSSLKNPNSAYSGNGIGNFYVKKQIDKLEISGGYLYDQIGSGAIFRAYEERPLFIDNALLGVRLKYQLSDNLNIKAFSGKQKYLFGNYPAIINGVNIEGYYSFGSEKVLTLAPGLGILNKTHDKSTIDHLVNTIKNYIPAEQVIPEYNTLAGTVYSTVSYDPFTLYVESAWKSKEVFFDPNSLKQELNGEFTSGKYINQPGNVFYTTLSFAKSKIGITAEYKRTKNFDFRVDPSLKLNEGLLNFIPPMNRLNTYTLTARYSPATQLLTEQAYQFDVKYSINKSLSLNVNYSNITTLENKELYKEFFSELHFSKDRKWKLVTGLQYQKYNQPIYEGEGSDILQAITPFADFLYRFNRKTSLNTEIQYMHTKQDYGSWLNIFFEFAKSPHWSLEASAMYNIDPSDRAPKGEDGKFKKILYPSFGGTYTKGSNRFSLRYVKQVEGVVCSGGVCRLEPAFSGLKFNVTSRF
jgi:hypothetical protein